MLRKWNRVGLNYIEHVSSLFYSVQAVQVNILRPSTLSQENVIVGINILHSMKMPLVYKRIFKLNFDSKYDFV